MVTSADFDDIVKKAKNSSEGIKITPRKVFNSLGLTRRTVGNLATIDKALSDNELEMEPHYDDVWIDVEVSLRPKKKAERKLKADPIKRLKSLKAANTQPNIITRDSKLSHAMTIMEYNDFSQLPVCKGTPRSLEGFISWETIGRAQAHGINSGIVADYMSKDLVKMNLDTPLLKAIDEVYRHEFIVVIDNTNLPCGIVTTSDLSLQFIDYYKPFALIEEIENHIRRLLDGKILLDELKSHITEEERRKECNSLDDLTFGEYHWMMGVPEIWDKLRLDNVDKSFFLDKLNKVRQIRNDVMHFEPAGITTDQMQELHYMVEYIRHLPA